MIKGIDAVAGVFWFSLLCLGSTKAQEKFLPGHRTVADAHNCYPYGEWWFDRIDRALAGGVPLAIEQDLVWYRPRPGNAGRSLIAHGSPLSGTEPGMEEYFFKRIQPLVESALLNPDRSQWPLITLNLDIKTEEPEHLKAIWNLLSKYQSWLTTAPRTADASKPERLSVGPILVLNGLSDAQETVFYKEVPLGGKLLTFGAVHTDFTDKSAAADVLETESETNYRRWWNNPWTVVEPEGQQEAVYWTAEKEERLQSLVAQAHRRGLWIRFYTLDGATPTQRSMNGWYKTYNFPSLEAAKIRWRRAVVAKVDYLASDQYELISAVVKQARKR